MFNIVTDLVAAFREGRYKDMLRLSGDFMNRVADLMDQFATRGAAFQLPPNEAQNLDIAIDELQECEREAMRQTTPNASASNQPANLNPLQILAIVRSVLAMLEWLKQQRDENAGG